MAVRAQAAAQRAADESAAAGDQNVQRRLLSSGFSVYAHRQSQLLTGP